MCINVCLTCNAWIYYFMVMNNLIRLIRLSCKKVWKRYIWMMFKVCMQCKGFVTISQFFYRLVLWHYTVALSTGMVRIYTHVGMSCFRYCHYYSCSFKCLGSLFTILVHYTFICFILLFIMKACHTSFLGLLLWLFPTSFIRRSVLIMYVQLFFPSNNFYTMMYNILVYVA